MSTTAKKTLSTVTVTPAPTVEPVDLADIKDSLRAKHLAKTLRKQLLWDELNEEWFHYKDNYWQHISDLKVRKGIITLLDSEIEEGTNVAFQNNTITSLKIELVKDNWNNDRKLLPMNNGVLNLDTMTLLIHDHSQMFNWKLPYDYVPNAMCPTVDAWLLEASSKDHDAIAAIRAAMYFSLLYHPDTQKFMEIVGPGGTGKSTLVRLIQEFIGKENHVTTDLKNLEGNQFETAMLYGKRVAFINDSSRYGGDVNVLKAITGGDPVRMEKKRVQQGKSFRAESFIYIVSNEAIQSTDYTSGLSRRRVPVNFMRQVSDADKDKWEKVGGIEKAMRAELPGLLNWVISMGKDDALAALGGINGKQSLTSRQHQIDTNPLAAWTEERCVLVPGAKTYTGGKPRKGAEPDEIDWGIAHKLFPNYHNWCHVNSSPHSLSVQNFGKHLEDLLKRTLQLPVDRLPKDKNGRAFSGIVLRTKEHSSIPTPILGETLK